MYSNFIEHFFSLYMIIGMLVILSIQDIKNYEVNAVFFILTSILIGIRGYRLQKNVIISIIIFLILNIIRFFKIGYIAYADIFLMCSCITNIATNNIGIFFLILSISSILFCIFKKTKVIPLIPFITLAFYLTCL